MTGRDRLTGPLPQRIAILRALTGLGDFLCLVPALRALRVRFPGAKVTLVGLPELQPLVERFGAYIDHLLEFPGYPGLPERSLDLVRIPAFLAQAQAAKFDLALQLHGSGVITNPLLLLLGARINAGFYLPGQYYPEGGSFLPWQERESEIRRYLRLLTFLDIPAQGEYLEFPLHREDEQALARLPQTTRLRVGRYVCLHPGASRPDRRWSLEKFVAVARALAQDGLTIVLTGSRAEGNLTQAIAAQLPEACLDLAGQTSLGALGSLLASAQLLICNDTGVSHLAAALRTPSVVLFNGADPQRWAPLDRDRHRVLEGNPSVEAVLTQAQALLNGKPAYVA